MNIKSRLNKLGKNIHIEFAEVIELIRQGKYYDELTEKQKEQYNAYKCSLGGVDKDLSYAELQIMLMGIPKAEAYHFKLSKREKPPTEEDHRRAVKEIEQFFNDRIAESKKP